jgi:hypothetical protein
MNNNNFTIKNLDSGEIYDIRIKEDSIKIDDHLTKIGTVSVEKIQYVIENMKIQEKINTKFFKYVEKGDHDKVLKMLNKNLSEDRRPNVNETYLHNYTVLHIAISNGKK